MKKEKAAKVISNRPSSTDMIQSNIVTDTSISKWFGTAGLRERKCQVYNS